MALNIKHLNADSTFLLTLAPPWAPSHARDRFPGTCSILIDPWLVGPSSILNPRFQLTRLIQPPCVASLADLPSPDLIIISQGKPDHCHKETLCTLPKDSPVTIVAVPDAYRQIKSWKHFTHAKLIRLDPYHPRKDNLYRHSLPSYVDNSSPGELTVSYLEQAGDLTGLHNGVGVTYRPPASTFLSRGGAQMTLPLTPPISPLRSHHSLMHLTSSSEPVTPAESVFNFTPTTSLTRSATPSLPALTTQAYSAEQTISILYTPHGVSSSAIEAYAANVLRPTGALPPLALFHAVNIEENPWYLGGKVVSGLPGGIELIKRFGAKYWVSAHDEVKENSGIATKLIKSRAYEVGEAQDVLDGEMRVGEDTERTLIVRLNVGEEFRT